MEFDEDSQVWKKHERVYWLWSTADQRKFGAEWPTSMCGLAISRTNVQARGARVVDEGVRVELRRDLEAVQGVAAEGSKSRWRKQRPKKIYKPWDM